ncbi:hypothetical protein LX32DRAFT_111575 [Colletotrichum zoysiae]|uniref:Uncharacterized protein n=1 Tax=Colletotrichum zoysiae TaxID=1216348 RepID=A0AAD9H9G7_9PEZI|nr:hypothetical protein LX32DRAFT_111575 [Colletotrichum zoysiae]
MALREGGGLLATGEWMAVMRAGFPICFLCQFGFLRQEAEHCTVCQARGRTDEQMDRQTISDERQPRPGALTRPPRTDHPAAGTQKRYLARYGSDVFLDGIRQPQSLPNNPEITKTANSNRDVCVIVSRRFPVRTHPSLMFSPCQISQHPYLRTKHEHKHLHLCPVPCCSDTLLPRFHADQAARGCAHLQQLGQRPSAHCGSSAATGTPYPSPSCALGAAKQKASMLTGPWRPPVWSAGGYAHRFNPA